MKPNRDIPTVPLPKFIRHSLNILKNPLPFHHKNFQEKGDSFQLQVGFSNYVVFSRDAKWAEYVLQKNQRNYTKSKIQTEDLSKYVGKGLLTSEGEHWKRQRKLIQPAFHKKQLAKLMDTIESAIKEELKKVEVGRTIDVFPIFNDLAFQVVVKSLFSTIANSEDIQRLQYITETAQKMLVRELRQPYLGWYFKHGGVIDKHLKLTEEARDILKKIVSVRRSSSEKHDDLLDMLLAARYDDDSFMDEEQLIDEILILFTAGHETTSNALSFTMQLLAKHPKWQDEIYKEIESIGDQDLMMRISKSKICQQVINESMRLYPPAYFIDRVNIEEDTFQGKTYQAGTNLLFSMFEIHRHPEFWKNPNEFFPERFEEGDQQFSSFYFPFGAGPRKCIGNNFAMFEMVLAIQELLKNYHITPKFDDIEIKPLITLKPKNALVVLDLRC